MVVIGDVTGRGAKAAAVTAHARYTLRTAAALTGDPVVALRTLNRELLARQRHGALQRRRDGDLRRPGRAGAARRGRPPAAAAGRRRLGHRGRASPAPVLGAFADETWALESTAVAPGQQLVVVTDGVTEAVGDGEPLRRGAAARRSWPGVSSPALAAQRIEGALHEFTGGNLDDDAAIVAIAPASADVEPASERRAGAGRAALRRLQPPRPRGDRRRSATRGWASSRSAPPSRSAAPPPTSARRACSEYLRDVERAWDELLITPKVVESRGGSLLVRGRVYARSRHARHPRHPGRLDLGPRRRRASSAARSSATPRKPSSASPPSP